VDDDDKSQEELPDLVADGAKGIMGVSR
jgi:hypothetical protein